jgi:hypothetical protein
VDAVEFVSRQRENTGTVTGFVVSLRVVVVVKFCLGVLVLVSFNVVGDLRVDFWVCSKSCYNRGFILLFLSRQSDNTEMVAGLVVVVAFLLAVVVAFNLRVVVGLRVVVVDKLGLGLVLVLGFDVVVSLRVVLSVDCWASCSNSNPSTLERTTGGNASSII